MQIPSRNKIARRYLFLTSFFSLRVRSRARGRARVPPRSFSRSFSPPGSVFSADKFLVDSSGKTVSTMGCLARDNNDNNDANALHRLPAKAREELHEEIEGTGCVGEGRRTMRDESEKEESRLEKTRREKEERWEGEGRGREKRSVVWVEMENLPTELFLARILRPAVCQNEEGNIISLPSGSFSPVTTLTFRPSPPSPSPYRSLSR